MSTSPVGRRGFLGGLGGIAASIGFGKPEAVPPEPLYEQVLWKAAKLRRVRDYLPSIKGRIRKKFRHMDGLGVTYYADASGVFECES